MGYSWTLPDIEGRKTVGGMRIDPSFFALFFALVVYTASHIAEIVRGSMQAVPRGQGEAAELAATFPGGRRSRRRILGAEIVDGCGVLFDVGSGWAEA